MATEQNEDPTIYIRRQWNDWRIGSVPLSKLHHLAWDECSGGVMTRTPQPFIHGYCWCNEVEGEIAHSCRHGAGPHWIKVCVVKKDNERDAFEQLLEIVGPKPIRKEGKWIY